MFNKLFPDADYASIYDIPFEEYRDKGIKGIIFDIDNTLVPHDADADERVEEFFDNLRALGLKTCLVSNNDEERVKRFNRNIGSFYIFKAHKPKREGYVKAMKVMETDINSTISVGDQLFTDMWGTNNAGLFSILVKPINPKEEIQIILKRRLEKPILLIYRIKKKKRMKKNRI